MCRAKKPIRIEGDVAYVPLTKGREAVIDACDVGLVSQFNWHLVNVRGQYPYAMRVEKINGKRARVFMHRAIAAKTDDLFIDHIDGNGLNNRRSNLRQATPRENSQNQRAPISNTSGQKGVCWNKRRGKWQAQIRVDRKLVYLGLFARKEDAAAAYDAAAVQHFGKFANLIRAEAAHV